MRGGDGERTERYGAEENEGARDVVLSMGDDGMTMRSGRRGLGEGEEGHLEGKAR